MRAYENGTDDPQMPEARTACIQGKRPGRAGGARWSQTRVLAPGAPHKIAASNPTRCPEDARNPEAFGSTQITEGFQSRVGVYSSQHCGRPRKPRSPRFSSIHTVLPNRELESFSSSSASVCRAGSVLRVWGLGLLKKRASPLSK